MITTTPIRWGILATGGIATTFVEDLHLLPDAHITAVGSRTHTAAQAFADRHGITRAHATWTDLATDPDVDIVYVATPHHAHHDAVQLCLQAGKPVLCEKPFTLTADETRSLTELAHTNGLFLMEAMWMNCNPTIRRLTTLLTDGALGPIHTLHADFSLPGPFDPTHRLRDPALGGGALLDLGVYPVSLAHLLLGTPDTITATAHLSPEGVDVNTAMLLGYPSALALLSCGLQADAPRTATIAGPLGRIELPPGFFRPDHFTLHRTDAEPETFTTPYHGHGMTHEATEAMRCLREGLLESPLVPWAHTIAVMETLDQVRTQIGVHYPADDS